MKYSIFLLPLFLLIGCSSTQPIISEKTPPAIEDIIKNMSPNSWSQSLKASRIKDLHAEDWTADEIIHYSDDENAKKWMISYTWSHKTMMDYLLSFSNSDLWLACDGHWTERNKENRKKLIETYDEKNGYILLKDIEHIWRDSAGISQESEEKTKNYWTKQEYWPNDYNVRPLHQIVRYYTKEKEPIIVINVECGEGCMCNKLSFFKDDTVNHTITDVTSQVWWDWSENIICKNKQITLSNEEKALIQNRNLDQADEAWARVFAQNGTRVLFLGEWGKVEGYAERNGSKFGCEE